MKIIDLLNQIANGENINNNHMAYFNRQEKKYDICLTCLANLIYKLDNDIIELNDEVEIIEEEKKIPEKIEEEEIEISMAIGEQICANKINEIIDYLKSKGE